MKNFIFISTTVLLLLFSFRMAHLTHQSKKELNVALEEGVQMKNHFGNTISMFQATTTNLQKQLLSYSDSIFKLGKKHEKQIKEIKAFYSSRVKTRIDSVDVPYIDTPAMRKWEDSVLLNCKDVIQYYEDSSVLIGTKASIETPYYTIDATVNKASITIDSLSIIDTQYVRVVMMKGGLFKKPLKGKRKFYTKPYPQVEVMHKNPYIQTIEAQATIVEDKRSGKPLLTGAVIGASLFFIVTEILPKIIQL
jgi:hypothetical protein